MRVELFAADDAPHMAAAAAIRLRVFVEEQGVPPDLEFDEHDRPGARAVHALAVTPEGEPAGTGRFYAAPDGAAQIGRMAVLPAARGMGAGAALLEALLDEAERQGFTAARLDAQVHARGFYARAGFQDDGETLWDAGILHQPMRLAPLPSRKRISRS